MKIVRKISEAFVDLWEKEENPGETTAEQLAQAAIEALGVVVLPKDVEPEVGDYIEVCFSSVAGLPEGCSGLFRELFILGCSFQDFLDQVDAEYEKHKIIQRNGKPVIYDKEK